VKQHGAIPRVSGRLFTDFSALSLAAEFGSLLSSEQHNEQINCTNQTEQNQPTGQNETKYRHQPSQTSQPNSYPT
jgi:hypothetical protein